MTWNRGFAAQLIVAGLVGLVLATVFVKRTQQSRRRSDAALDDMIEDSFPASDPPSHSTITSTG